MEILILNSRGNPPSSVSFKTDGNKIQNERRTIMPAEIESIMWYGERPWHGLGTQVLETQTSEEALVKAGLDWEVAKKKLFISDNEDASGSFMEVDGNFAIVRKAMEKPSG